MLSFKTWLVQTLTADSQLQTLLGASASTMPIFPTDADITPEQFPCITYADISDVITWRPQGVHMGRIQLDLWSTTNALETETIYERLGQLLNFQDSTTQTVSGTLWWVRQDGARDFHTPSRRLWHKSLDLKYVASNASLT